MGKKTKPARKSAASKNAGAEKRGAQPKAGRTGAQPALQDERKNAPTQGSQKSKSTNVVKETGKAAAQSTGANAQSQGPARTAKPPKRKNVSQTIPNGTLVHTTDDKLYGADGNSIKSRMATVIDSNRNNEVAIVKYTTSTINGVIFINDKGFVAFGNRIYTKTADGSPITITENGDVQKHANNKRDISPEQANQIKKSNLLDSKYRGINRAVLKELKGRKQGKNKKNRKK